VITLAAWCVITATLSVSAFVRPIFGVSLYLWTFFAFPGLSWWGHPIGSYPWSLISGIVLLMAVAIRYRRFGYVESAWAKRANVVAILIVLNATFVHFLLAPKPEISYPAYNLLCKFTLLFFLFQNAIRNALDFKIALLTLVLCGTFVGYQVTIEKRGKIVAGRLEGIGAPGATSANTLSSLIVPLIPISGGLLLTGNSKERLIAILACPLILNTLILCNSRGAFLGAMCAAIVLLYVSRGPTRKYAVTGLMLGIFAAFALTGDQRIIDRFFTTFASESERDASASSRLDYWKAGLAVIRQHPFGSGGDGFKSLHGPTVLSEMGIFYDARSVHNGFINEACEWGVQGILLRIAFLACCMLACYKGQRKQLEIGNYQCAFLGVCILASLSGFLVHCMFGSFLDAEWGMWMAALASTIPRVFRVEESLTGTRDI